MGKLRAKRVEAPSPAEQFRKELSMRNVSPKRLTKAQIVAIRLSGIIPCCLYCDSWEPSSENPDLGNCLGGQGMSWADEMCPNCSQKVET